VAVDSTITGNELIVQFHTSQLGATGTSTGSYLDIYIASPYV